MAVGKAARAAGFCAVALLLQACSQDPAGWSKPKVWADGQTRSTATLGLALTMGRSGTIQMTFGAEGTAMGDETAEALEDVNTSGALPVGTWYIEKGSTRITLPRESSGFPRTHGLYENSHSEIWGVLVSEGCATLVAKSASGVGPQDSVVERRYALCDVAKAAQWLRESAGRSG